MKNPQIESQNLSLYEKLVFLMGNKKSKQSHNISSVLFLQSNNSTFQNWNQMLRPNECYFIFCCEVFTIVKEIYIKLSKLKRKTSKRLISYFAVFKEDQPTENEIVREIRKHYF